MKKNVLCFLLMIFSTSIFAQLPVQGTSFQVCPDVVEFYTFTLPTGCSPVQQGWIISGNTGTNIYTSNGQVYTAAVTWSKNERLGYVQFGFNRPTSGGPVLEYSQTLRPEIRSVGGITPTLVQLSALNYCERDVIVLTSNQINLKWASLYEWTLPNGWTINGPVGGSDIVVRVPNDCVGGTISVRARSSNLCSPIFGPYHYSNTASFTLTRQGGLTLTPPTPTYQAQCEVTAPVTFTAGGLGACVSSYQWTYPSGYTVSGSSNSASIVLVPSGTTADAGNIKVTATLSCGNVFTQSYPITFNSTPVKGNPIISGPSGFCSGGFGSYGLSRVLPAGATITWAVTGGLTIASGQNTPTVGVVGYGSGTVGATITTSCGTSQIGAFTVVVTVRPGLGVNYTRSSGISQPLFLYAPSDTGVPNPNNICLGYTSGGYLMASVNSGVVIFTAISGLTLSYRDNRSAYLNIFPGAIGIARVTATNSCGTDTQIMAFTIINCGSPTNPSDPTSPADPCNIQQKLYNISPNPASEQIKIGIAVGTSERPKEVVCPIYSPKINAMNAVINSKDGITFSEVNIYNNFGILVLSKETNKAKEFVIPLQTLKVGLYLVQIREGEHVERHQIIIE